MRKLLIIAFISLLTISKFTNAQDSGKKVTLEDIWQKGTFRAGSVYEVRSLKDGEHYCVLENNKINEYSYKDAKLEKTILDASNIKVPGKDYALAIEDYQFSLDESKILISIQTEFIYRHSSKSEYYIWDIKANKLSALSTGGKQRLADFSPDGSKVAFIRDNNLFIKDISKDKEIQLTTDGLNNNIIYGTTDWVYEEEFSFTKAFFWSKDGNKIAYYRFDESKVKEYTLAMWGDLYPEQYKYKYPKAGEDNSVVSVFTYDVAANKSTKMDVGTETNQYIPRIYWTSETNSLAILRMNRLQNKLEILLNDANSGQSKVIYTEDNKYYIEITDDINFIKNGFVITSEMNGYNHIYYYDMKGKLVKQVTTGKWDVVDIKGVDESNNTIFFRAANSSPINKELYSVKLDGSKMNKISDKDGTYDAQFSSNFKYYISTYSNANTPPTYTINLANGKELNVLENNMKVKIKFKDYNFTTKEFASMHVADGVDLNYWIMKPKDFDPSKKYPVLMYVYGGPGHNTVLNSYDRSDYLWYQMLSQKGYIIVSVDNRGTAFRGEEFKKCTYKELGKLETEDYINAAKWLGNQTYIDKDRIGIFGWSYGGFMSTLCMTKGADYFKAGIAVAPVTNWRYYDNIYTERFMRTPQENPSGYDDNSPINHVKKLKGKFLLVHGTGDDNVHVQNSLDLINALVNANKQFEMKFYTNKNHSIYGGFTRLHLYTRMTDFLIKNL